MARAKPTTPIQATINSWAEHVEHVSLESDVGETRALPDLDKRLVSFELRNPARGVTMRISILDGYYVAISTRRRSVRLDYNVDLRFIDPKPAAFRDVAW